MATGARDTGEERLIADAKSDLENARRGLDAANEQSRTHRTQFFERLSLLNGAALVVSVTLVGYFFSHPQIRIIHRWVLETAWGCMLTAMAAGLGRNHCFHQYLWYASFRIYASKKAQYQDVLAQVIQTTQQPVVDRYTDKPLDVKAEAAVHAGNKDQFEKQSHKAQRQTRFYKIATATLQYLTPILTLCGLTLLVVFAAYNLPR